jgi:hypothetical protein
MIGGIGRNQKPGRFLIIPNQRLKRIAELPAIHTFGGRGSPLARFSRSGRFCGALIRGELQLHEQPLS